jgi:O-antigen ligase
LGPILSRGPLLFFAAAGVPALMATNDAPSPTVLNQAAALGAWGLCVAALAQRDDGPRRWGRSGALQAGLVLLLVCALGALTRGLPVAIVLSGAGMLLAAGLVTGAAAGTEPSPRFWRCFFGAWLLAGGTSVLVGLVQVFAPAWADGDWVARSGLAGRAVGNLRQPNHLATLLLWAVASIVPLYEAAQIAGRRRTAGALAAAFALLLFGVVLTGSRTGLVGAVVLLLWGLIDARLSRLTRGLLMTSPLVCALSWGLLEMLASAPHGSGHLGAAARIGTSDPSAGRVSIWRDTLGLLGASPWLGVGWGNFNFAWSLSVFPERHPAFFDHTHNLPLQLAVELGLPLALLVLSLLAWGLWQAFDRSRRVAGPEGTALRACFVMVLLMALHSQLEYPLWYAYFLLPTAFAWGLCLGANATDSSAAAATPSSSRWIRVAGIAMLAGALLMWWDYRRVVEIFAPGDDAAPLAERIAAGQRSWFFAHHADYARVTTPDAPVTEPGAFDRATHYLLDTRLMIAWAQSLAARGDVDRARHLAARLREFRNPNAKPFFEPCDDPQVTDKPFQCQPPERAYDWRDFRR